MSAARTIDESYRAVSYVPENRVIDESFHKIFKTPDVIKPRVYMLVTPDEERLIYALGDGPKNAEQLSAALKLSAAETDALIKLAYHRANINKSRGDTDKYVASDLYGRLGVFTQYEPELWKSIPQRERAAIDDWYINAFTDRIKESIEKEGDAFYRDDVWPIEKSIEVINGIYEKSDVKKDYIVTLCNCRTTTLGCNFSTETCISNYDGPNSPWDRGHGRRVSLDEVAEIMRAADKEGLMHTVSPTGHICNCETCCCYEFRAAAKLNTKGKYPRVHYVASLDTEKCVNCGLCAKRCHFNAFYKSEEKQIRFDPTLCWGCGICETTCPKKAISIVPLKS
jgi:Pyruvate/2-oxoacid:ferredoxin oxidoreductase delta subunit